METIGGFDWLANPFYEFYTLGGEILIVLMVFALVMWSLIVERYLYFAYLSRYNTHSERGLVWIRVLIKVSLLSGLLGTVLGLIAVFEAQLVSAAFPHPQLSAGISKAIVPTTAGLFVSLSGVYFANHLRRLAGDSLFRLDGLLSEGCA